MACAARGATGRGWAARAKSDPRASRSSEVPSRPSPPRAPAFRGRAPARSCRGAGGLPGSRAPGPAPRGTRRSRATSARRRRSHPDAEPQRREARVRLEAHLPAVPHRALLEAGPGVRVAMGERVVVAEGEQRLHAQPQRSGARIAHQHRLLPRDEQHPPLHLHAADRPDPHRPLLEREADQPGVAVGVERVRILVDRERHRTLRGERRLLEAGERHHARHRRMEARHQQPVVAPRIRAGHGAHGEAAGAVGEQPLQPRGSRVQRAHLPWHLDRRWRGDCGHRISRDGGGRGAAHPRAHEGRTCREASMTPFLPFSASRSIGQFSMPRTR